MRTATCRTFLRVYTPTMYAPVIKSVKEKSLSRKYPRPAHKLYNTDNRGPRSEHEQKVHHRGPFALRQLAWLLHTWFF